MTIYILSIIDGVYIVLNALGAACLIAAFVCMVGTLDREGLPSSAKRVSITLAVCGALMLLGSAATPSRSGIRESVALLAWIQKGAP